MEFVTKKCENDEVILGLKGRLDTNTVPVFEQEINELKEVDKNLVLDLDDLDYISSAGLRVVLRQKKEFPQLRVINCSQDVYQVFEMTGFTEMMDISKGMRKLSIDGCKMIGRGAHGTVYRYSEDTIVKVYKKTLDSLSEIMAERELSRKAFILGVPTAISFDVVRVGDYYGSVFELLDSKSFSEMIIENPDSIDEYADEYAQLLKLVHSTKVQEGDFPNIKAKAYKWADYDKQYLTDEEYAKLRKMIDDVPDRLTLIHGDYHTNNLMLQNGEILLIDMDTLSFGHPIFDLANMYVAQMIFPQEFGEGISPFLGYDFKTAKRVWKGFVKNYFSDKSEEEKENIIEKIKLLAYARVVRHITKKGIVAQDKEESFRHSLATLKQLIKDVDSLDF